MSLGGEGPVFGQPIGYTGSFSYSYDQVVRKDRDPGAGQERSDARARRFPTTPITDPVRVTSVLWGGLLNLSTRMGEGSKISFNNTYTRGGDNEATVLGGDNEEFSQFNPLAFTRLDFIERSVRSNQLAGRAPDRRKADVSTGR